MSILAIYGITVLVVFVISMLCFMISGGSWFTDPFFVMDIGISAIIAVFWFIAVPVLIGSALLEAIEQWKYGK